MRMAVILFRSKTPLQALRPPRENSFYVAANEKGMNEPIERHGIPNAIQDESPAIAFFE
jgi:hypothetical protein